MIRGPCGTHNPRSPCTATDTDTAVLRDGCAVEPKADGDPTFVRNVNNGSSVEISDCWVVPYNPYLKKWYKAHVNVEVCASVHATKYVSGYVYEGPDRTTLKLDSDKNEEVNLYLQGRYCGPTHYAQSSPSNSSRTGRSSLSCFNAIIVCFL